MAYANADDIADRLGRELDESEARIVEARLQDVEDMILARSPDITTRIASNATLGRLLVMVEADAVIRLIRNPEGVTQESDGNYSYSINWALATGRLQILPEEWSLLGVRSAVYTLSPKITLGRRAEGEVDPYRGLSSPETASFEQGVWQGVTTPVNAL